MHSVELSGKQSQHFIKYQSIRGCSLATNLLLNQLEYWFTRQSVKKEFYKFIEPCNNYLYREGDSWCEEIGISADIFRRTFRKIGTAHKSYGQYQKAQDKFEGKAYASYYNRQNHKTFFIKNPDYEIQKSKRKNLINSAEKVKSTQSLNTSDHLYSDCPQKVNQQPIYQDAAVTMIKDKDLNSIENYTANDSSEKDIETDQIKTSDRVKNLQSAPVDIIKNTVYSKPYNTVSSTRARHNKQRLHSISLKKKEFVNNFKIKNNLFEEKIDLVEEKKNLCEEKIILTEEKVDLVEGKVDLVEKDGLSLALSAQNKFEDALAEQMIIVWEQVIGNSHLKYRARRLLINLYDVLREHFEGSLYQWQAYCKKIASSKFLMGEGKAWKLKKGVFLLWGIKEDNIAKIKGDAFSLGDRVIPLSHDQAKINRERFDILQSIKAQEDELEALECNIGRIRRDAVCDRIDSLFEDDSNELKMYQEQFEAMLMQGHVDQDAKWLYHVCKEHFEAHRWQQMSREGDGFSNPWRYLRYYLTHLFADQHFKQTQQQMIEEKQHEINHNLAILNHKLEKINVIMNLIKPKKNKSN